jgi:hypothetical protein
VLFWHRLYGWISTALNLGWQKYMRGTGIFLATGLMAGFFIGKMVDYVVWGTIIGMVVGLALAILANWAFNNNR